MLLRTPEFPEYIRWYHENDALNYSIRGGISVTTDKNDKMSTLLVSDAQTFDTGNYTCAPARAKSESVIVHILNGKFINNLFKF